MTEVSENVATLFVTYQLGFFLCLGLTFLKDPQMRKWYSTLIGLLLGFYFHGVSYLVCILHFSCVYPLMKYLPREKTLYPVVSVAALVMIVRNFFNYWEGNLDGSLRVQCTVIFMRIHMAVCNYQDAGILDDTIKGKNLLKYERE